MRTTQSRSNSQSDCQNIEKPDNRQRQADEGEAGREEDKGGARRVCNLAAAPHLCQCTACLQGEARRQAMKGNPCAGRPPPPARKEKNPEGREGGTGGETSQGEPARTQETL